MMKKRFVKFGAVLLSLAMALSCVSAAWAEFSDVSPSDYFFDAVQWGAEEGITVGVGNDLYDPAGEVTRAQIVTFLWRMAGQPEPTKNETFDDVEAGAWYEVPVLWAVEQNITKGTGDNRFSPDLTCDRAMCLTLLYRLMGSPLDEYAAAEPVEINEDSSLEDTTMEQFATMLMQQMLESLRGPEIFPDVTTEDYFELAAYWGVLNQILTDGNTGEMVEGVTFRPHDPCVRAEMISFLYQTKLMKDRENAPLLDEYGPITIAIPQEYEERVYRYMYGLPDDEDGTLVTFTERASHDAAEAMGTIDPEEAGVLFSIKRVSEDELHNMLCGEMAGNEVFAKDENGKYYIFYQPTDFRMIRETNEQMEADMEEYAELCSWADGMVRSDILQYSTGLTPVSYTNTALDMLLARTAYQNDVSYTVSTTQFGALEPIKGVDAKPYIEFLLEGNFLPSETQEAPDGEYVVLNFPKEGVRYDFFVADPYLVREVRGESVSFFEASRRDRVITDYDAMLGWYEALAVSNGKIDADKSLDAFVGDWYEKIAGRGMLTVEKYAAPKTALITATWPDSAAVMNFWKLVATVSEDGTLVYKNGTHSKIEFDEEGGDKLIFEVNDETGSFALTESGELSWFDDQTEGDEPSTFMR